MLKSDRLKNKGLGDDPTPAEVEATAEAPPRPYDPWFAAFERCKGCGRVAFGDAPEVSSEDRRWFGCNCGEGA